MSRFILTSFRINYIKRLDPSHSYTPQALFQVLLLRRPLPSPPVIFCIPIASTAHTVLARACHRNLYTLKFLLGIAGNQIFGERLDATARSLSDYVVYVLAAWTTTSSTSWWRERLLHLFSGDRLWDYTTNHFLHQFRTAISNKTSQIVWLFELVTTQLVPPALVPFVVYYLVHVF